MSPEFIISIFPSILYLVVAGELRKVKMVDKRISEATKLGFSRVVIPASSQVSKKHEGLVIRCANVRDLKAVIVGGQLD